MADVGVGDLLVENHGDAVVLAPILPLDRVKNIINNLTKIRLDSNQS